MCSIFVNVVVQVHLEVFLNLNLEKHCMWTSMQYSYITCLCAGILTAPLSPMGRSDVDFLCIVFLAVKLDWPFSSRTLFLLAFFPSCTFSSRAVCWSVKKASRTATSPSVWWCLIMALTDSRSPFSEWTFTGNVLESQDIHCHSARKLKGLSVLPKKERNATCLGMG